MCKNNKNKGFTLLYAILLTSAVLVVGVSLINIITRQLILTSLNKNSQIAYYNARSVVDCLNYYDQVGEVFLNYNPDGSGEVVGIKDAASIFCSVVGEDPIELYSVEDPSGSGIYSFKKTVNIISGGSAEIDFTFNLDNLRNPVYSGCHEIQGSGTFQSECERVITVRGSNLSVDSQSSRKVERTAMRVR